MANRTRNSLRYIKQILYELKKRYGLPLDLYHNDTNIINPQTGKRTETKTIYHIKKAIVLPLILALKNYAGGTGSFSLANYEVGDKFVLIDFRDLPDNYIVTLTDYIIVENIRYKLISVENYEIDQTLRIVMREVKGQLPNEIHVVQIRSEIKFIQRSVNDQNPHESLTFIGINTLGFQ